MCAARLINCFADARYQLGNNLIALRFLFGQPTGCFPNRFIHSEPFYTTTGVSFWGECHAKDRQTLMHEIFIVFL